MLEGDLYSALSTNAAVGAIVGGTGQSARIYPMLRPQGAALPAVTYQLIDRPRIDTASLTGNNAKVRSRMQIDCWAESYSAAKDLAAAVKNAVNSALTALNIDERDLYEDDTGIYRISSDFSIWHLES